MALHEVLSSHFELNSVGPINPGSDYPAKAVSKLRRMSGFSGSFHFFSKRRLMRISQMVTAKVEPIAESDFFHGSTPWILYESPRPYFAYVDTCFSTYVDVYHHRSSFLPRDLERIFALEANWLSRAAAVFFGTQWALEQVLNDYSISQSNLKVVGAAGSMKIPDLDRYQEGIRLLFIALDFKQKGGQICVEAFRKVQSQLPDAELVIVGGDPDPEVLALPGVRYEGFLSKSVPEELSRLSDLYSTAFALVHPTSSDIQPLVISEAGYFGCPAIAPRSFGIPELIHDGVTGYLIDLPLTADAFAERIVKLATDRTRYMEMRKAARANAIENQTWPAVGERIAREIARASSTGSSGKSC